VTATTPSAHALIGAGRMAADAPLSHNSGAQDVLKRPMLGSTALTAILQIPAARQPVAEMR
jgi:hypothetical protein